MAENQTDAPHETMDLAVWSPFRDLRFQAPAAPDPQKVWIWAQSHSNLPMWRTATWRLVEPPEEVLAVVRLGGRDHYLGPYDSPASHA